MLNVSMFLSDFPISRTMINVQLQRDIMDHSYNIYYRLYEATSSVYICPV